LGAKIVVTIFSRLKDISLTAATVGNRRGHVPSPQQGPAVAVSCKGWLRLVGDDKVDKSEILALGSLPKWPWRCSAAGGSAACGARGRPPRLACSVPGICARARLKRLAPARLGAAATNCGPCPAPLCSADLQAPGAGAGGSPGACAMRGPAASPMEGTAPLLRGPRRVAVPDGHPRRDAVAQAGFPAVVQRGAAGGARARLAGRQQARGACWRAFCCGMWWCSRALTGVVCCCCALLRRAGFRNVADEQQRRQWGRDLPIILPVGARRVHRLNPFQQHGAMTGVGSGALAL
jgi:hypothetical protein